jgi:DNA-damage-inducible protein D
MAGGVMETGIAIFRGKEIRKTIHNNEWWFSVADVVQALTDSTDTKQYIKKIRKRDQALSSNWGTICTPPLCWTFLRKDGNS